jgi:hypothetical protein
MWMIDPNLLCNPEPQGSNHLLGEHNEIHKAYGSLLNHPHGEAIIKGQVKESNIDTTKMKARHDKLAKEMKVRGYNHDSPFQYEYDQHYGEGCIDVEENIEDLKSRCESCTKRIRENALDNLVEQAQRLNLYEEV